MSQVEDFKNVLKTYGDLAYRMAFQLTGGREAEARDLVQELFIKIWSHWDEPKPTSMKGWMYRVMRNLYIDAARKRARHPQVSIHDARDSELTLEDRLPDKSLSSHDVMERKENEVLLHKALKQMTEEFRTPVMLCDIEGLRYEDIARILDCPIGTIRSRIHRGRQELRNLLKAHMIEEVLT